ncbi:MAG: Uma2 family endonuclease, partial [Bacteroidota bacterium]
MATVNVAKADRSAQTEGTAYISLDTFLTKYADVEDGMKYEWNDGIVEITESMNQEQLKIYNNLLRCFVETEHFRVGGILTAETDMFTSENQLRRPDLAIYTKAQIEAAAKGENQVAAWVAEVISNSDNLKRTDLKIDEYFAAGVQVVWQIMPFSQKVYVFTAPEELSVCRGETVCSAAPAFPTFELAA